MFNKARVGGVLLAVLIGCTPAPPPGGQSAAMTLEEATSWTSNARRDSFPASSPFQSSTAPFAIGDAERSRGWLWNTSCPVAWEQLEVLTVRYKGFDGKGHTGRLLVKRGAAAQLAPVFKRLYQDGFRFEQVDYMITLAVIQYPHLASNNTYSFKCRQTISGGSWSAHAYGTGIDINPVQNPYHVPSSGYVFPPAGGQYLDRRNVRQGMITANGLVETAFYEMGWTWGGRWNNSKDYMHFSQSGR